MVDLAPLRKAVAKLLGLCSKAGMAGCNVDHKDGETISVYAAVLAAERITADDVRNAMPSIVAKEEYFPRPATVVKHAAAFRDERRQQERQRYMASLVEAVTPEGVVVMAEPSKVRDGRLIQGSHLTLVERNVEHPA